MLKRHGFIQRGAFGSLAAGIFAIMSGAGNAAEVLPNEVVFSEDMTIDTPLTDVPGDPFRGLEIFVSRKLGNCVACHLNYDVLAMQFLGDVGPELNFVGDIYTEEELRAIIVDPKVVLGDHTIMPGFYTTNVGVRVAEKFEGKPILSAQQVEDVVAYLASLSEGEVFEGID